MASTSESATPVPTIDSLLLGLPAQEDAESSVYIKNVLAAASACAKAAQSLPVGPDFTMYDTNPATTNISQAFQHAREEVWDLTSHLGVNTSHGLTMHIFANTQILSDQINLFRRCTTDCLTNVSVQLRYLEKYKNNKTPNGLTHFSSLPSAELFSTSLSQNNPNDPNAINLNNNNTSFSLEQIHRIRSRRDIKGLGNAPTKPQILYEHQVDNSYAPFRPVLRSKPNALVELDQSIVTGKLQEKDSLFPHPYKNEILSLEVRPDQVTSIPVYPLLELTSTPCFWVDTNEDLLFLKQHLDQQSVFAIDVEHHSQHSYQGLTCLIQISTRVQDFLIDALVLHDKLQILNSSFTNPRILKVLHGCNMDVLWLQRDFGLYLVNIFDTAVAAKLLTFSRCNLAFLLYHYCNVKTDKQYQLADWRQRPLNREMLVYARIDTHYLLHIYSRLQNDLIDKSLQQISQAPSYMNELSQLSILPPDVSLLSTNQASSAAASATAFQAPVRAQDVPYLLGLTLLRSNRIALLQYEKENRPVLSARRLLQRLHVDFTNNEVKTRLFCAVYAWRDQKARELDEAPTTLLKNDYLINIAKQLPSTVVELEHLVAPINLYLRPLIIPLFHLIQAVIHLPNTFFSSPHISPYFKKLPKLDHDEPITSSSTTSSSSSSSSVTATTTTPAAATTSSAAPSVLETNLPTQQSNTLNQQYYNELFHNNQNTTSFNKQMSLKPDISLLTKIAPLTLEDIRIMRYSHPHYFIPEFLCTDIDKEWNKAGTLEGVESESSKLSAIVGWNGQLPQFPATQEKLARLNWSSARTVVDYALRLAQNKQNSKTDSATADSSTSQSAEMDDGDNNGYNNIDDNEIPLPVRNKVGLFQLEPLGEAYRIHNQNSGQNGGFVPNISSLGNKPGDGVTGGKDSSNDPITMTPLKKSFHISASSTQRSGETNQALLLARASASASMSMLTGPFLPQGVGKESNVEEGVNSTPAAAAATTSDTKSDNTNELESVIASSTNYQGFVPTFSAHQYVSPLKGNPQNHASGPTPARTKESVQTTEEMLNNEVGLDWVHDSETSESAIAAKKTSLSSHNNITEQKINSSETPMPITTRQVISKIPGQLGDIYKLSYIKKQHRVTEDTPDDYPPEASKNGTTDSSTSATSATSSDRLVYPSELLFGKDVILQTAKINDADLLHSTGYLSHKDQNDITNTLNLVARDKSRQHSSTHTAAHPAAASTTSTTATNATANASETTTDGTAAAGDNSADMDDEASNDDAKTDEQSTAAPKADSETTTVSDSTNASADVTDATNATTTDTATRRQNQKQRLKQQSQQLFQVSSTSASTVPAPRPNTSYNPKNIKPGQQQQQQQPFSKRK